MLWPFVEIGGLQSTLGLISQFGTWFAKVMQNDKIWYVKISLSCSYPMAPDDRCYSQRGQVYKILMLGKYLSDIRRSQCSIVLGKEMISPGHVWYGTRRPWDEAKVADRRETWERQLGASLAPSYNAATGGPPCRSSALRGATASWGPEWKLVQYRTLISHLDLSSSEIQHKPGTMLIFRTGFLHSFRPFLKAAS